MGRVHAERVDGPAIKRWKTAQGGRRGERGEEEEKEEEERSGRMLQHVGGCMKSDVEKQEQESNARLHEGEREREREREREPMYPVFEPKVLRAS